jgi:hypothetical protein
MAQWGPGAAVAGVHSGEADARFDGGQPNPEHDGEGGVSGRALACGVISGPIRAVRLEEV